MRRDFRGRTLKIEVKNPNGVCKGVTSLLVDRKAVEGNFIPLAKLKDGSRIVAVLG
jgi:hypothetical protein